MVKIRRTSYSPVIDPTHRNKKETLDSLWSDTQFLKHYLNSNKKNLYNEVIEIAQSRKYLTKSKAVADVGCGPGFFLRFLTDKGFQGNLYGYDFSDGAVEQGRRECPKAIFNKHDIYNKIDLHFDLLFCMETLEHLDYPERALKNLLDASDVVILTVPDGRNDTFQGHINFWSIESWKIFIKKFAKEDDIFIKKINNNNLLAIIEK